jgi:hypothetical protein
MRPVPEPVKRDRDGRDVSGASPHRSLGDTARSVRARTAGAHRGARGSGQTRGTGRIGKTPTTIGVIGSNDSS